MLTRQPTELPRGGGLKDRRNGARLLNWTRRISTVEYRLLEESDKYMVMVCETCGLLAYHDVKQNKYICRIDGDKAVISPVQLSMHSNFYYKN